MFGTFGVWDKSLDFRIFLGHMALGQNVIGTIYPWAESVWDNSPTEQKVTGSIKKFKKFIVSTGYAACGGSVSN